MTCLALPATRATVVDVVEDVRLGTVSGVVVAVAPTVWLRPAAAKACSREYEQCGGAPGMLGTRVAPEPSRFAIPDMKPAQASQARQPSVAPKAAMRDPDTYVHRRDLYSGQRFSTATSAT
jgi:hypothetical protein